MNYEKLQPGEYVACVYDRDWYVGCIEERSDENCDVYVNFMHKTDGGLLSWPGVRKDTCWVPFQNVICFVSAPELKSLSARSYMLTYHDAAKINQKLHFFL